MIAIQEKKSSYLLCYRALRNLGDLLLHNIVSSPTNTF